MNPQQLLLTLIQQLELLTHSVNESPYISREERLFISKELDTLSHQLNEGEISFTQGEQTICQLNKRAAADEIVTLSSKIRQLNPASPRLENLRTLGQELQADAISPLEARQRIQTLMRA